MTRTPHPGLTSTNTLKRNCGRKAARPRPCTRLGTGALGIPPKDQFRTAPLQISTRSSRLGGRYMLLLPPWWRHQRPKWLRNLPEAQVKNIYINLRKNPTCHSSFRCCEQMSPGIPFTLACQLAEQAPQQRIYHCIRNTKPISFPLGRYK